MTKCSECGQDKPKPTPIVRDMYGQPIEFGHMLVWLRPKARVSNSELEIKVTLSPVLLVQTRCNFSVLTGEGFFEVRHYDSPGTSRIDFKCGERLENIVCLNKGLGYLQSEGGI